LAEGVSFVEQLKQDWSLVLTKLQTTHLKLAEDIRAIIRLAQEHTKPICRVSYSPHAFGSSSSTSSTPAPTFIVSKSFFCGHQYSLFYNEHAEDADEDENTTWNVEYLIRNERHPEDSLHIKIGGDDTRGVISYIENYGFYEGGLLNDYRVDPVVLQAVLTGNQDTAYTHSQNELLTQKQQVESRKRSSTSAKREWWSMTGESGARSIERPKHWVHPRLQALQVKFESSRPSWKPNCLANWQRRMHG